MVRQYELWDVVYAFMAGQILAGATTYREVIVGILFAVLAFVSPPRWERGLDHILRRWGRRDGAKGQQWR